MEGVLALVPQGVLQPAVQPPGQPTKDLATLSGYTIPLIAHDYPAKTALLWNEVYVKVQLPYRNCMMVGSPEQVAAILDVCRADPKYRGGGAGVGFKTAVLPHLDDVDSLARAMGAVNIIVRTSEGELHGYNTDGIGFVRGLEPIVIEHLHRALDRFSVLVLGAGGAGDAIAFALARAGANVTVANRTLAKAEHLAANIQRYMAERQQYFGSVRAIDEEAVVTSASEYCVIINTTVKGQGELAEYNALGPALKPLGTPKSLAENARVAKAVFDRVPKEAIVCDIILGAKPTPLLSDAVRRGHVVQDGLPMVVEQAIDAFQLVHPDVASRETIQRIMWAAADAEQKALKKASVV